MSERSLQSKIIRWLKDEGAYVIKASAMPGVPVGCPDILFVYHGRWGAIEVKADAKAPFRTGQKATLSLLRSWNRFVYVVYPENWEVTRMELKATFF